MKKYFSIDIETNTTAHWICPKCKQECIENDYSEEDFDCMLCPYCGSIFDYDWDDDLNKDIYHYKLRGPLD